MTMEIMIPKVRRQTDVTMTVSINDSGVAISPADLSDVIFGVYSEDQRVFIADCSFEKDGDSFKVKSPASNQRYLGRYRLILSCTLNGRKATYDAPAYEVVKWSEDVVPPQTLEEAEEAIGVHLSLEEVSSSLVQDIVAAAIAATAEALEAAEEARNAEGPQGPQGEPGPAGPQGPQGETGPQGPAVPVVNDLTTGGTSEALSAEQGKQLGAKLTELSARHLISDTYIRTDAIEGGKTTQEAFLFRYKAGNALSITLLNIGENSSVNIILNYTDGSNTRLSNVGINSEKVVTPEKDIVSIGYYASKTCEITIQIRNNSAISINAIEIENQKRLGTINTDSYEFKSTNSVRTGSSQYKVFPFGYLAGKPLFVKLISPATVTLVATFSDGTTGILKQSLNVSDSEIIIVPDKEIAYLGYYVSTSFGSTVDVTLSLRGNYAMIEQINDRIGLLGSLAVINSQSNLYDASNVIIGYEVYTNGKPAVQANSAYIKLAIEAAFGAGLTIKGLPAVSTGLTSRYWSFMDINNNVIKTGTFTQNSNATQYVIIPNNAAYFLLSIYQRVSGDKPSIEDISIIYGVDEQTNSLLLKTENLDVQLKAPKQHSIVIFGDSITETDSITFVSENEPYTTNINYLVRSNWPKFMLLGIDSRLRVSEMRNYANSGASFENHNTGTPRQYLAFQISEMLADLSAPEGGYYYGKDFQPDIVIISCGTNDIADSSTYDSAMSKTVYSSDGSIDVEATLQNLDTENSFSEAVRYAFMKIRSIFPDALCFYCTPIQRKSQETPQQILDVAKALAKRYAFNIVDCNSDSIITRENSSIFLSDGLHPNLDGQKILAKFIVKSIVSRITW